MMGGVIPEVAGQSVVPLVHYVKRGFVLVLGRQTRVVVVGMPGSNMQRNKHGQKKDDQRIQPIVVEENYQGSKCQQ